MAFVKNSLRQGFAVLAFMSVAMMPAGDAWAGPKRSCKTDIPMAGIASVYSKKFQGRRTASGKALQLHELTAAHRCLPFGTLVRVTDQRTKKSVTVRITDNGPFVKGRIIDLTPAAMEALGHEKSGLFKVALKIERLGPH